MSKNHSSDSQLLPWQSFAGQTMVDRLQERCDDISDWLMEHAPSCDHNQEHLNSGTTERAYWHYGYAVALRDVLALLKESASTSQH